MQKDIKNTPITNGGFVYNMPSYNKESGLLPKITQNGEKKEDEKTRVLYSREKNNRREKEEAYTPVIAQSEIRKVSDNSKTPLSELGKQYLRQMPEEKETIIRQSKQ